MSAMIKKETTIATLGRAISITLEHYGCDSKAVFDAAGLDISLSYDPGARYDSRKFANLWRLAAQASGDPAFGLEVPRVRPPLNPALDAAFSSSDNLLQALDRLCKMFHFVNEMSALKLSQEGSSIFLEYITSEEHREVVAFEGIDALFAALIHNIRQLMDPDFKAKGVYFVRPEPEKVGPYLEMFNAPVMFGQSINRLEFDSALLSKPLLSANPEIAHLNEQIVLEYLERSERDEVLLNTRFHIIAQLPYGEPNQEVIAGLMNISSRQLRRKLNELGTNYSQVLLDVRHEMAKKYLSQNKLALSEITQLLGFSDQSNFTKAFKRWQGETPITFRKNTVIAV